MKKCASCGAENEMESKFCENCCSTKFIESVAPNKPMGLNFGDANAIDADDIVGHKEVVHGKKEQIMGNKEEINAQNYTVNQTIVQQTNIDIELVELEKEKHRIEMEKMRYEAEMAKLQAENMRQGGVQQNGVGAKSMANGNAQEVEMLRAAIRQNEAAMVQIIGAMAEQEEQMQRQSEEHARESAQHDKEQDLKSKVDRLESILYDMERSAQFSLSAEIGQRQYIIWISLCFALFIMAAATAIPFFWILLLVCIVMLVRSIIRKVKLGSATNNTIKIDDYARNYTVIRRQVADSGADLSRYITTLSDFDDRLRRAKDRYQNEVAGAGSKAMIYVAVISAVAIILSLIVAYAVIS